MTMQPLADRPCEPCRKGAPTATPAERADFLPRIPDWRVVERDGVERLERVFPFGNFREALEFTNRVGEIAESEQHHPAILTEWGRVTVSWWTHEIGGLHHNDFVMAARTDRLFSPR